MNRNDRIVAVGLLTASDLERLGSGFERAFPIKSDADFADLILQLEAIEWVDETPAEQHG